MSSATPVPLFRGYPPFLAKILETPKVTPFLEGPAPLPLDKGVGEGGPTMIIK